VKRGSGQYVEQIFLARFKRLPKSAGLTFQVTFPSGNFSVTIMSPSEVSSMTHW
jgi:hypothetical protein